MKPMSRTSTPALCRHAGCIGLLCALSTPTGAAQSSEPLWPPLLPAPHIQQSTGTIDPPPITRYARSASPVHAATGRYDWKAPPASGADWQGIKKDTWYFLGYQFAALGMLYVAPESVSGWTDEQRDDRDFTKWKENAGNPVWDEDSWWINYVLHPYWGGAYYIRARERGFDHGASFLYSALLSTLYEFGAEALFEEPSYQDLVVTPVAGYVVGRYLFEPIRERIRAQPGEPDWTDKTVLFLTDPLGVVNFQLDRVFGVHADAGLQLGPMLVHDPGMQSGQARYRQHGTPGDPVTIQGWGVHLRLSW